VMYRYGIFSACGGPVVLCARHDDRQLCSLAGTSASHGLGCVKAKLDKRDGLGISVRGGYGRTGT